MINKRINKQQWGIKVIGFTLIELMIVLAIIAILVAITFPSYQDSVRKARRTDAQADLIMLSTFMEQYYTENSTYIGATLPVSSISDYYTYSLPVQTATSYTVQSTPTGNQTNDLCGTMTISSTNVKTATYGGSLVNDCW